MGSLKKDHPYATCQKCGRPAVFLLDRNGTPIWSVCFKCIHYDIKHVKRSVYKDIIQEKHISKYGTRYKGRLCLLSENRLRALLNDLLT